ncbi:MAG TPA: hypothetical protein VG603_01090, partial [Chitinophagales bacterium]|nr:hypothetical protein [Chitinophagales bacterium]
NWTIDRTRTFTRTTGNYVNVKLSSEASGNVSASGTNRYGEAFTNAITTPIQATNNPGCLWKPYVGTFIHKIANRTVTVDFGVDSGDNQVGSADNCAANDGFFVTYTRANRTRTRFVEYWH